ncbi:GNAT family N-acetyltransferase [Nocardia arizonensis]|nr:GNAT family N-acetyltransferase [Nocardia arizonensis]
MKRTVQLTHATVSDLDVVESWLRDGRVCRWLGGVRIMETTYMEDVRKDPHGPGYVAKMHKLAAREVGHDDGPPVGYVAATVYGVSVIEDRWTVRSPYYATLLYAVDPDCHRGGLGAATLQATIDHPDLAEITEFHCGIAVRNIASRRIARRVGFVIQPEPRPIPRRRRRILSYVYHRST